jgi:hypothetical protein
MVFVLYVYEQNKTGSVNYWLTIIRVLDSFRHVGEKGIGQSTGKPLTYKGAPFHRIIPVSPQVRSLTSVNN